MTITKNEILFIYKSDDIQNREALGYVYSLKNFAVKERDILKEPLTELQLAEILQLLGIPYTELVHREFQDPQANLSKEDTLKQLANNPQSLKTPIAVYHNGAEFITSPYSLVKKDLAVSVTNAAKSNEEKSE